MAMSWYKKGNEGLKTAKERQALIEMRKNKTPRFWLKTGEEAKIVFVDDTGFYCDVHQFKLGDKWNNFATCVRDIKPCPLCDAGLNPTWTAHYTVIDMREFEIDGKVYKNIKKLFPAKGEVIQIIADLKEKYGSLKGRVFRIKRYGAKEPNTGTHFEYIGKIKSFAKLGEDADKPFNYVEVLKPPTKEEYEAWGFSVSEELTDIDEDEIDIIDDDIEVDEEEISEEEIEEDIIEDDIVEEDEEEIEEDEEEIIEEEKPKKTKKEKPKKKRGRKKTKEEDDEVEI